MTQSKSKQLWDKFWKDKDGKVVVMQAPNIWLYGWIAILLVSLVLQRGRLHDILHVMSSALLSVWAFLELIKGVNYFRKTLGLIVLVFTMANLIGVTG